MRQLTRMSRAESNTATIAPLKVAPRPRLGKLFVAIQAGTSRPVLYRRWSSVSELAMDAIRQRAIENSVEPPDTGNLRDDLVTFLDELGKRREEILVLSYAFSLLLTFAAYEVTLVVFETAMVIYAASGTLAFIIGAWLASIRVN